MSSEDQVLRFSSTEAAVRPRTVELDVVASALQGNSLASTQLRAQIRRVAPYFRSLSLIGEKGCGDEAVARLLHQTCPLHELSFVVLRANDAEERFAPEIATPHSKEGLLYLPEAEKLSRTAQEGLLRMLRQQVGQSTRVVAFAGRGLKPYIAAGFFLPELAGCLGSLRMALPTLRERTADLPMLIHSRAQQYRMERAAQGIRVRPLLLSDAFMDAIARYHWPGNLDQLNEAVDWLLEHKSGGALGGGDLTQALEAGGRKSTSKPAETRLVKLDRVVQEHIRAVLLACNGNKLKAAEVLGISRSTLYRMLESTDAPELLMAG